MNNRWNKDKKLHLVFDILGTLALNTSPQHIGELYLNYFVDKKLILSAEGGPYLLYPGTVELMQYLFKKNDFKISFFSNIDEGPTHSFVEKLLLLALGKEQYVEIKEDVVIKSCKDLIPGDQKDEQDKYKKYGLASSQKNKDLRLISPHENEFRKTILIEDEAQFVPYEQVRHLLPVFDASLGDLAAWKEPQDEVFYQINHLFYILGIITNAIEHRYLYAIDYLFNMNYNETGFFIYLPQFRKVQKDKAIYELGLTVLKEALAPNLEFLTLEHMKPYLNLYHQQQTEITKAEKGKKNKKDFLYLLTSGALMIDKSLVIDKILNLKSAFSVFLGPSCGKTLNLSMMRYFFDSSTNHGENEFLNFNIGKKSSFMSEHYKQYSVLHLDFSDVKAKNNQQLEQGLHKKIAELYEEHHDLLNHPSLRYYEKKRFEQRFNIIKDLSSFPKREIMTSLKLLANLIRKTNAERKKHEKPILIINHYDDLISNRSLSKNENEWRLLNSFFENLKDCDDINFILMSGKSNVLQVLPNNCVNYNALAFFACSSTEAQDFIKKNNISLAYNELALPFPVNGLLYREDDFDCINQAVPVDDRWYLPKTLVDFVKEKKTSKDLNGENKPDREKAFPFSLTGNAPPVCTLFYNPNTPFDEIDKSQFTIAKVHSQFKK